MYLVRFHGLVYAQVPQVASNLIFCDGKDLISPVFALKFRGLRDVGIGITTKIWGNKLLSTSALSTLVVTSSSVLFTSVGTFSLICFFNLLVRIIVCIPCQIQLERCLRFPDLISAHPDSISVVSWLHLSLAPLPVYFLHTVLFDQGVLTQHVDPLPSLPDLFPWGNQELLCFKKNVL